MMMNEFGIVRLGMYTIHIDRRYVVVRCKRVITADGTY